MLLCQAKPKANPDQQGQHTKEGDLEGPWCITHSQLAKLPSSILLFTASSAERLRDSRTALCSHATESADSKMSQGTRQGQCRRQGTSMYSMLSATDCWPCSCCSCCRLLGRRRPPYACIKNSMNSCGQTHTREAVECNAHREQRGQLQRDMQHCGLQAEPYLLTTEEYRQ